MLVHEAQAPSLTVRFFLLNMSDDTSIRFPFGRLAGLVLVAMGLLTASDTAAGEHFTRGSEKAWKFGAQESPLRGLLRQHCSNPRAWMTDDGQWFVNLSDTGYRLFRAKDAPLWREFVRDAAGKGITCMRAASLGGWGGTSGARVDDNKTWVWNDPWAGGAKPDYARFDLAKFQNTDERLIWILDHYPEMYLQFI